MGNTEERKSKIKANTIIAVIAFVFSALGVIVGQTFLAGKYANTIENNKNSNTSLRTDFEAHKKFDDETYLKKETFEEYKQGKNGIDKLILERLTRIENKLDKR